MTNEFYGKVLAGLHDQHYSEFVNRAAAGIVATLRKAEVKHCLVLDLGCGGGQLAAVLARRGYQVFGLDISPAMIKLARKQQIPRAQFACGSVLDYQLPKAAAAIAVGEVFNYLESPAAVRSALVNVARAIEDGGFFIFDIKQPLPGPGTKTRSAARWGDDWAVAVNVNEYPGHGTMVRKIVAFQKQGKAYVRSDEQHRQVLLRAAEIKEQLTALGFSVEIHNGFGRFKVPDDHRVIVARKGIKV